jgi:hypothetical protein
VAKATTTKEENKDTKRRIKEITEWKSNNPTRVTTEEEREMIDLQEKSLKSLMKTWVSNSERISNLLFKLKSITSILMIKMKKKMRRTKMNQSKTRSQENTISLLTNVLQKIMERKKQ